MDGVHRGGTARFPQRRVIPCSRRSGRCRTAGSVAAVDIREPCGQSRGRCHHNGSSRRCAVIVLGGRCIRCRESDGCAPGTAAGISGRRACDRPQTGRHAIGSVRQAIRDVLWARDVCGRRLDRDGGGTAGVGRRTVKRNPELDCPVTRHRCRFHVDQRHLPELRQVLFAPWLPTSAVGLVTMATISIVRDVRRGGTDVDDAHGHRGGMVWLLLVPVVLVVFVVPPPIQASSAPQVSTNQASKRHFPPLPAERAPTVAVPEVMMRAATDEGGTLANRLITVIGFTMRSSAGTDLARVVIICCAADAQLARVHLAGPAAAASAELSRGHLAFEWRARSSRAAQQLRAVSCPPSASPPQRRSNGPRTPTRIEASRS